MLYTLRRGYATARAWTYAQASEWLAHFDKSKIPNDQLRIQFSRSSGPGGQNVNKGKSLTLNEKSGGSVKMTCEYTYIYTYISMYAYLYIR